MPARGPLRRVFAASRLDASGLWTVLVFAGAFAIVALVRYRLTSDGFMTLYAGREVAQHGIPVHNWLSAESRGARWVDEQWLSQWLLYRVWSAGGYAALAAVSAGLVACAYALFARILLDRGAHLRRTLKWTAIALAAALPDVAIRAQAFAYLCFVLLLLLLLPDLEAPSRWRPVAALPLLVAWANLHGSVLLGAGLLACYCLWRAAERRRPWYLLGAAAAMGTVVATPYGAGTLSYYRATLGNGAIRSFASEWQPVWQNKLAAVAFVALVLAAAYATGRAVRRGVRPPGPTAAAAAMLTLAGLFALRWDGFAAFVVVVLATDLLNVVEPGGASPTTRRLRIVAASVAALIAVGVLDVAGWRAPFDPSTPTAAAAAANAYAVAHPSATILADDHSASALLWLYPALRGRVALDDRLELFPQATVRLWGDFIRGRGSRWMSLVDRYRLIVASRSNPALVHRLTRLEGLRVIYRDSAGVVFLRR
jgi:hypothetical protein